MESVAYVRVSSKAQDYRSQRAAIERAARARGDAVVRWYSEKLSGRTVVRPELEKLRQAARAGHVRRAYVYRLDRLTRSGIRDTFEVVEELRTAGSELVTVADGYSTGPRPRSFSRSWLGRRRWSALRLASESLLQGSASRPRVDAGGGRGALTMRRSRLPL